MGQESFAARGMGGFRLSWPSSQTLKQANMYSFYFLGPSYSFKNQVGHVDPEEHAILSPQ